MGTCAPAPKRRLGACGTRKGRVCYEQLRERGPHSLPAIAASTAWRSARRRRYFVPHRISAQAVALLVTAAEELRGPRALRQVQAEDDGS